MACLKEEGSIVFGMFFAIPDTFPVPSEQTTQAAGQVRSGEPFSTGEQVVITNG